MTNLFGRSTAKRCGISERVSDAITGHAAATVGRIYEASTVEDILIGAALIATGVYLLSS